MNLLAIDCATEVCSCALEYQGVRDERFEIASRRHATLIIGMIDNLLRDHYVSLNQLDAIVVTSGPGSFTGLRIGAGIAQGLAYGAGIPLIPLTTLEVLAESAYRLYRLEQVITVLDARMGEIYWGCYQRRDGHDSRSLGLELPASSVTSAQWQVIDSPKLIQPSEIRILYGRGLSASAESSEWAAVGAGVGAYSSQFEGLSSYPDLYPHAIDALAVAAAKGLEAGPGLVSGLAIAPQDLNLLYLRNRVTN